MYLLDIRITFKYSVDMDFIIFIYIMDKMVLVLLLSCLTLVSSQTAYPCNVENCQACSYYNFCGRCDNNYILSINK